MQSIKIWQKVRLKDWLKKVGCILIKGKLNVKMSGAELGYKSIYGKALNYWSEKGLDEKAKRRLSFSETWG